MATIEQARAAKERVRALVGRMPELRGVGIARVKDGFCVKINLVRWPEADLPSTVDGVPVRIDVVGEIRALSGPAPKR